MKNTVIKIYRISWLIPLLLLSWLTLAWLTPASASTASTSSAIVLTKFDIPSPISATAFVQGTTPEEMQAWFASLDAQITAYDADGNAYQLPTQPWIVEWVNSSVPDLYEAWAFPDLGDRYQLAQGVSPSRWLSVISIQEWGYPEINCFTTTSGALFFPWVLTDTQQTQLDQFTVWLQQGNGEPMQQLDHGFVVTSAELQLSRDLFSQGESYRLQVQYPGGETGILTFYYSTNPLIVSFVGGNRDGGGEGTTLPGISQPAPTPSVDDDDDVNQDSGGDGNRNPASETTDDNTDNSSNDSDDSDRSNDSDGTATTPSSPTESPSGIPINPAVIPGAGTASQTTAPQKVETEQLETAQTNTGQSGTGQSGTEQSQTTQTTTEAQPSASTDNANINASIMEGTGSLSESTAVPQQTPSSNEAPLERDSNDNHVIVAEEDSAVGVVLAGSRLLALIEQNEPLVVRKNGITASISASALQALKLNSTDVFALSLTQPTAGTIQLSVSINNRTQTDLPVYLTINAPTNATQESDTDSDGYSLLNEAGNVIGQAAIDNGTLSFLVNGSGIYRLADGAGKPLTAQISHSIPVVLSILLLLLILASGFYVWRRRQR